MLIISCTLLATVGALTAEPPWRQKRLPPVQPDAASYVETCPIRLEVELGQIIESPGKRVTIAGTSKQHCRGTAINEVRVTPLAGTWSPVNRRVVPGKGLVVAVEVRVWVPPGDDRLLGVKAELVSEDAPITSEVTTLEGDEGEVNWGDKLYLSPPAGVLPQFLRIEVSS